MTRELRDTAERLRSDRRPFVAATVVRAERPTSAKAGDMALVLDDGTVVGFVGGECAESSVKTQARAALRDSCPIVIPTSLLGMLSQIPHDTPPAASGDATDQQLADGTTRPRRKRR